MKSFYVFLMMYLSISCTREEVVNIVAYQTSAAGDQLTVIKPTDKQPTFTITLDENKTYQTITGFGGAFTESSAFLLNQVSKDKRKEILQAYFSENGANYSLTRTHMNSCDFSLGHYSYASTVGDTALLDFNITEDLDDVIPMIKDAQAISKEGFKIVASPWTAPPWMKDNNHWHGGKLLEEYYSVWAQFFSKYYKAYQDKGIDIWAFTVENEPLGNDSHWESMHYTPEEMATFVKKHLGPQLKEDGIEAKILVYDQNRGEELEEWATTLLNDKELKPWIYGTAVHWYTGTQKWFPESLQLTKKLSPDKHIIHTEGCIDAEVPHWNDDTWYWKKEATDWGYEWAKPENKHNHPKYVPTYRYARDIIGCLNNWVEGWIDWNMVLDEKGGPNHAENWCIAPVLVDTTKDEVYFTPLYYVLCHFSKFIRPGAERIDFRNPEKDIMVTAVKNTDGSVVVEVLNMEHTAKTFNVALERKNATFTIAPQAIQTIVIN